MLVRPFTYFLLNHLIFKKSTYSFYLSFKPVSTARVSKLSAYHRKYGEISCKVFLDKNRFYELLEKVNLYQ